MGGDGGVVATNRRYMRNAGGADQTANLSRRQKSSTHQSDLEAMRNCALTGTPLDFRSKTNIVACVYGKLYNKEAVVEALLRRRREGSGGAGVEEEEIGSHIRGLKDLFPVRFHLSGDVPTCPITGVELNGSQAAFLIVKKKGEEGEGVNVLSERAIKEMGLEELQLEYGPFEEEDMIRLAPSCRDLEEIKEKVEKKRGREEEEKLRKKKKKTQKSDNEKKRKDSSNTTRTTTTSIEPKQKKSSCSSKTTIHCGGAVETARNNVAYAVKSNSVLSSLFVNENDEKVSDKEKKDNLFVR